MMAGRRRDHTDDSNNDTAIVNGNGLTAAPSNSRRQRMAWHRAHRRQQLLSLRARIPPV